MSRDTAAARPREGPRPQANDDCDLHYAPLQIGVDALRRHFARRQQPRTELRNPHHEPKVDAAARRRARPAAVLIGVVDHANAPTLLLTRRHQAISFGGHVCFPGGSLDPGEGDAEGALREAREEIGLKPERVQLLGRLGDYVTHSGFRIAPLVGVVTPPLELVARPGEVAEILEIPLDAAFRSDSYHLRRWRDSERAHYFLRHGEIHVAGPTVSLLLGLYEEMRGGAQPEAGEIA